MSTIQRQISKSVRAAVRQAGTPYPIVDQDGFAAPKLVGRSYYWTTPNGKTEVRHPSAYVRAGGDYPIYHGSTLRIVVGRGWLLANVIA